MFFGLAGHVGRSFRPGWFSRLPSDQAAVFPVWDILFGTFRTATRRPHETMELGLGDPSHGGVAH